MSEPDPLKSKYLARWSALCVVWYVPLAVFALHQGVAEGRWCIYLPRGAAEVWPPLAILVNGALACMCGGVFWQTFFGGPGRAQPCGAPPTRPRNEG